LREVARSSATAGEGNPIDRRMFLGNAPSRSAIGAFSAADIMLGHSIYMSHTLGCIGEDMPNLRAYVKRIESRPAFETAINMQ